jgi:hypothetical protein
MAEIEWGASGSGLYAKTNTTKKNTEAILDANTRVGLDINTDNTNNATRINRFRGNSQMFTFVSVSIP